VDTADVPLQRLVHPVKLPKTSTGKIQKYMLREKEWTGQARWVHG
jgi:acyl-coenzyme A synthetase/AMP-(fatty) acid ligase